ncbi:hypothetical protein ACGFY9_22075 [Streptomyces sp. NPDC048504]|uniref:hypothetical protein n=1 Tax=Streptomyces sp. NPDC048504 TaxID=3365559 RepID=UPI00371D1212
MRDGARLVGNAAQAGTAPGAVSALLAALAGPVGGVVAPALIDPWLATVFLGAREAPVRRRALRFGGIRPGPSGYGHTLLLRETSSLTVRAGPPGWSLIPETAL